MSYKNSSHSLENIIGVKEAAKILGYSPQTTKNMCAAGKLLAKKLRKNRF
ncbi:hypothetical protein BN2127_JRS10_03272 [Bacillus subtilis]|nr:hypothetical protein BN2127_JRS10_03272 [Bacillus subtilis]